MDLRWAWECAAGPSPFAGDDIYQHAPMLNDVLTYALPPDTYAPMLDHNRPRIGLLLLTVAGVAAQDVADDYALTGGWLLE